MPKPKIFVGADHAGFELKEHLKSRLLSEGHNVEDLGADSFNPDDDYPVFAKAVAERVAGEAGSFGILSCGNAIGVCVVANKQRGVRAGIGYSIASAKSMRNDDDANVLCLPGRLPVLDDPWEIVRTFLDTNASTEERHLRRRAQIE